MGGRKWQKIGWARGERRVELMTSYGAGYGSLFPYKARFNHFQDYCRSIRLLRRPPRLKRFLNLRVENSFPKKNNPNKIIIIYLFFDIQFLSFASKRVKQAGRTSEIRAERGRKREEEKISEFSREFYDIV